MTSDPHSPSDASPHSGSRHPHDVFPSQTGNIDIAEIFARLFRGLPQIIGFAALGLATASIVFLATSPFSSSTTSMRVTFAFNGYSKGEYPDHSKFQPDDVRSPDIIATAIRLQRLENIDELASSLRASLTIEGLIPPNVIKERDRLRAAGQTLAPYIPDEWLVTLTLPRKLGLNNQQRAMLLNEIVSVYHEKFDRTYAEIPMAFGNAFDSLRAADFYEYELILNGEIQNIRAYLRQQLDQAKTFRSPTTNLSYSDLLAQTELFSQIRLNETLGVILQNGMSRNRNIAIVKMDYFLHTLEDQEQKAIEEEKVVTDLLAKSQAHSENYVLGIKSQATLQRSETPVLDQGLIDSLLANDSMNFLVRQALAAGLKVKEIQADKAQLLGRRKEMEAFLNRNTDDQTALYAQVQKSLVDLDSAYKDLISNIRKTQADFARQQYADAIRISMQPETSSKYRSLEIAGAVGGVIGLAIGMGLSLIGIYLGPRTM